MTNARLHNLRMPLAYAATLCLAACAAPAPAFANEVFPNRGRAGVVDAAGVIPDAAERALNERVVRWDRTTGHQLAVVTVPSLHGMSIAEYGVALGRKWGLGHSGSTSASDGVILLLAPAERQVRIEVGYGLEPVLTDARTGAIVRDDIVPNLRAGDVAGALSAGAATIMDAFPAREVAVARAETDKHATSALWIVGVVGGLLLTALGLLVLRNYRRGQRNFAKMVAEREAVQRSVDRANRVAPPPPPRYDDEISEGFIKSQAGFVERTNGGAPTLVRAIKEVAPTDGFRRFQAAGKPRAVPPSRSDDLPPPVSIALAYEPPAYRDQSTPTISYSPSDWGYSSPTPSSDSSSSSSSGFDSGGGSFGGGGADSSY